MLIALFIGYLVRTGKIAAIKNFFGNSKLLTKNSAQNPVVVSGNSSIFP
ncbi:hypothetical protein FHS10_001051 [Mucilaginibacter dorajii]|nr:hypothetical protein [Mucilaginibacter dorajii]MCS3733118.1 hypothetical protein [Mucilaginibacter dorajii]